MKYRHTITTASSFRDSPSRATSLLALAELPRRVVRQVARQGLAGAVDAVGRRLSDSYREWRLGIDTIGSIEGANLGHANDSFGYQPIPYLTLDLSLKSLDSAEGGVFVDYGCGKGRAVIAAARLPFRSVIGVEKSTELCMAAQRNVGRAWTQLNCQDVQIINVDARDFVPPDNVSVVFFFNPFDRQVLQQVLDRLRASLDKSPRPLQIIYGIPRCRKDWIQDCDWLEQQVDLTEHVADWERCTVYRTREPICAWTADATKTSEPAS